MVLFISIYSHVNISALHVSPNKEISRYFFAFSTILCPQQAYLTFQAPSTKSGTLKMLEGSKYCLGDGEETS